MATTTKKTNAATTKKVENTSAATTKKVENTSAAAESKSNAKVSNESYAARFKREQAEKKAGESDGGTEDNG